jgi:2-polyprenyl-3-methyl-5-hydroxy-6-metoxy-1,4-benzoquinol methylase
MNILRGLVHRRLLPRWLQREIWNREYVTGEWDSRSLHTPNDPLYELLTKYCSDRDICDIGSGHGNTITEMAPVYRSYTGVDISDAALRIAAKRAAEAGCDRVRFVQGFMHSYIPDQKPGVFLFRESLMYVSRRRSHFAENMAGFLQRYVAMLAENGVIIVRYCRETPNDKDRADQIEAVVRQNFEVIECRHTQQPQALLLVFQPFGA